MICPERSKLLIEYRNSVRDYSKYVSELVETVGLELDADLATLRRKIRDANEVSENSRIALYRHESDHFCDRTDFAVAMPSEPETLPSTQA